MKDNPSIEEGIAKYLITHNILFTPRYEGFTVAVYFAQYSPDGSGTFLGNVRYDYARRTTGYTDLESLEEGLQLPGFNDGVRRPLARLLEEVGGDLRDPRFNPLRGAYDKVKRIRQCGLGVSLGFEPLLRCQPPHLIN